MAEEYQGGVCRGNLWNSSRNLFGLSPCSSNLGSFPLLENTVFPTAISDDYFRRINHDLIIDTKTSSHESGRSEENYSQNILQESEGLNSNMSFCENSYNFIEQQPSNSFPLNPDSYSLLQTLFDTDFQTTNCSSPPSSLNYHMNSTGFSDSLTKVLPMAKPTLPKQQDCNNTVPFWNANVRASFVPSPVNSTKPNFHNFSAKRQNEEAANLNSKKVRGQPVLKRQRVETPSPLPTFKVRKEKLGDRVTALQQLVSPFGKTDTASVLQEAIEYIKYLHDQVSALSTPYLQNGSSPLQFADKTKDEGKILDLKSRGLCLVPISSTFPVAAETTTDFWTPTFGGTFR
ncbi:hypothetical protein CDL12_05107 [Handroanthus impetiginosus]|uniref:BHLH domain-containing protein n=1 Tax=Handroanthus impetiginosus TaxID=429701 RepID=A0A2G9HXE4_9LAMI|nr:hypothetical protein CDL12_05107 [Handroanthus impetiginosus]